MPCSGRFWKVRRSFTRRGNHRGKARGDLQRRPVLKRSGVSGRSTARKEGAATLSLHEFEKGKESMTDTFSGNLGKVESDVLTIVAERTRCGWPSWHEPPNLWHVAQMLINKDILNRNLAGGLRLSRSAAEQLGLLAEAGYERE